MMSMLLKKSIKAKLLLEFFVIFGIILHYINIHAKVKMSEMVVLSATKRDKIGTGSSRALRGAKLVPAVAYGEGQEVMSIAIQEKEITKLYRAHGFTSTVIGIEIDGKIHKVLPKAIQLHPITDIVSHVDFVFLGKDIQKVEVPIIFEGKDRALGVKRGGFFNIIFRRIALNCAVNSIPKNIVIDVTNMSVGASILASHLQLPSGCTLATKSELVIASITGRGSKTDVDTPAGAAAAA